MPDVVCPNLLFSLVEISVESEEGRNHPSIRAKSRRPNIRNNKDAPCLIQSITSVVKRGGV